MSIAFFFFLNFLSGFFPPKRKKKLLHIMLTNKVILTTYNFYNYLNLVINFLIARIGLKYGIIWYELLHQKANTISTLVLHVLYINF